MGVLFESVGPAVLASYGEAVGPRVYARCYSTSGATQSSARPHDLDFQIDFIPLFLPQLFNPNSFCRFEFLRLVNGPPSEGFYDGPSMLFANMFFTFERFCTEATSPDPQA